MRVEGSKNAEELLRQFSFWLQKPTRFVDSANNNSKKKVCWAGRRKISSAVYFI